MQYRIFESMKEHNEEVLNYVNESVSSTFYDAILDYMNDSGEVTNFKITKEPNGVFEFEDYFIDTEERVKGVYIDQYDENIRAGRFAGTIAIEIDDFKYFEFTYTITSKISYE